MKLMATLALPVLLAVTACNAPRRNPFGSPKAPRPESATRAYRACSSDTDCVQITDSCCDCSNGGQVLAVARDKEDAFKKTIVCGDGPCFESYGGCNEGTVKCEAGLCNFHPGDPERL